MPLLLIEVNFLIRYTLCYNFFKIVVCLFLLIFLLIFTSNLRYLQTYAIAAYSIPKSCSGIKENTLVKTTREELEMPCNSVNDVVKMRMVAIFNTYDDHSIPQSKQFLN